MPVITLTEMEKGNYIVYVDHDRDRTIKRLTAKMRQALQTHGHCLWRHHDFGTGRPGRQAQYHLESEQVLFPVVSQGGTTDKEG